MKPTEGSVDRFFALGRVKQESDHSTPLSPAGEARRLEKKHYGQASGRTAGSLPGRTECEPVSGGVRHGEKDGTAALTPSTRGGAPSRPLRAPCCSLDGSHTPLPVFGSGSPLHWSGPISKGLPKQARSPLQAPSPICPLLSWQAKSPLQEFVPIFPLLLKQGPIPVSQDPFPTSARVRGCSKRRMLSASRVHSQTRRVVSICPSLCR
jgi:hypothetical protein